MFYLVKPHRQTIQPVRPRAQRTIVREKAHPAVLIYTNLNLNALMLGASAVHWSSKFHLLITLFEK